MLVACPLTVRNQSFHTARISSTAMRKTISYRLYPLNQIWVIRAVDNFDEGFHHEGELNQVADAFVRWANRTIQ
jgi:hypothetical protein